MDLTLLLKIAGIGMVVAILCQVLKVFNRNEEANYVSAAGVVIVLFMIVQEVIKLLETVQTFFGI